MRLLLLNQYYPPDIAPTGRVLHDLARALVARGHEVHVVCSQRSYGGTERFPAEEMRDGVQIHRLAAFGFGRTTTLGRLADYGSFLSLALAKALSLPRPDLVLALTTPPFLGLVAAAVASRVRARHAHWVMDVYPDALVANGMVKPGGFVWRRLCGMARRQFQGASAIVALGSFMAQKLEPYAGRTVEWVPLWPDEGLEPWPPERPNSIRETRGWKPDELVLLYSGNMGLGHRFEEFTSAAERLGPTGLRWAFIGDGRRRAEIETFARAHPRARIELLPPVPPADLRESLCAADVHLASLSRPWQGLIVPSKVQASFAVGRPVIFVGPRENEVARWIEGSAGGWVAGEGDVDALLRALAAARDAQERARRGQAAAAFAQNQFDRGRNSGRLEYSLSEACRRTP